MLVSTQPVFVAILAYLLFGERTSSLSYSGILVALAGNAIIASDGSVGSATFFDNTLAVIGSLAVAVYVLIGRSLCSTGVGVLPYSIVVYASASATLASAALYAGVPLWGYSGETWFWLFAVTLGPQILGHTVLNWALRYVDASIISGTILAEPVVWALLAWLILSERPGFATLLGGAVVLLGLFLLLRGYRAPPEHPPRSSRWLRRMLRNRPPASAYKWTLRIPIGGSSKFVALRVPERSGFGEAV